MSVNLILDVKLVLFLFSVLLFFIAFHINYGYSQTDNTDYTTFTNETIGVSFEYPVNWEFEEYPIEEVNDFHNVRLESPDGTVEIEVIVFVTDNPSLKIQQAINSKIQSLAEDGYEYKSKSKSTNSLPFQTVLHSWKGTVNSPIDSDKGIYYFGHDDYRAYYLYLVTDKNMYGTYLPIFLHIKESFTLSDIESPSLQQQQSSFESNTESTESISSIPSNYETFTDDYYGIEISCPDDWIINEAPELAVVSFKPFEDDTFNLDFAPEFIVKYPENVDESTTLESSEQQRISEIENNENYIFQSSSDYSLDEFDAKAIIYRDVTIPEDQNVIMETFAIANGKLYTLMSKWSPKYFEDYYPETLKMFNTFKINETEQDNNSFSSQQSTNDNNQQSALQGCFRQCMSDMQGGQNCYLNCPNR